MKKFLAVYIGSPESRIKSGWDKMDESQRKEREKAGTNAWGQWMATHKASIVETGGPLGKTKRVGPQGIADTKNQLTGYVLLQAQSQDAAARLFEKHPHFAIFPGDGVEVMECLPIPGQPQS